MASRTNRVLTDRDEIRRWAEERNASPACVRGTGGGNDIGMLRLDFPGYSGAQSLEHIDWDEWFDKFEERGLALLVQDRTARGERSNFNKLVSSQTARASEGGRSRSRTATRTSARKRTTRSSAAKRTTGRTAAKSGSRAKRKSAAPRARRAKTSSGATSSSRRGQASRKTRSASTGRSRTTRAKTASKKRAKSSRSTAASSRATRRSSASTRGRSSTGGNVRSIESGRRSSKSHVLTDHNEIRRWAEARNAAPACVRGTGGGNDPGMIRLDFPGFSGARSLEHIGWNEWFRAFDDNNLALLVQDTRAGGGRSNFNKLIAREAGAQRSRGERKSGGRTAQNASKTRASARNQAAGKKTRGSTRAHRTESVRGRSGSQRRAA